MHVPVLIKEVIAEVVDRLGPDTQRARMFANAFPDTLSNAVEILDDGKAFVVTGDIPAMWLRDSAAQIMPYVRFASESNELREILRAVIRTQFFFIGIDPYANAFNREPNGNRWEAVEDITPMDDWVWERKYEIDSLCYPLWLLHRYWKITGDDSVLTEEVGRAMRVIVDTWTVEQDHASSDYSFIRIRKDNRPFPPTLPNEGKGTPVGRTGMTWCGFRPSDDSCQYGYLVPSNMFASVCLDYVAECAETAYRDSALKERALSVKGEIDAGIAAHGVYDHPECGEVYAYEVDGLGNRLLMDDANVPSLLSIPYLGYLDSDDELYRNTRSFILGKGNPYFVTGKYAEGIGSPHTMAGRFWPMSVLMRGLTSDDPDEIEECLAMVERTDADTGRIHESVDPDDPTRFTRPWFCWANSLYAELVLRTYWDGAD